MSLIEDRITAGLDTTATIGSTTLSFSNPTASDEQSLVEARGAALAENVKSVVDRFTEDDGYGGRVLTSVKAEELIPGSKFNIGLGSGNGMMAGNWAAWGQVSLLNFEREPEDQKELIAKIDGKSTAGTLGVEFWPQADSLVGVALVHSTSDADFTGGPQGDDGNIETTLTMLQPYGHMQLEADTSV